MSVVAPSARGLSTLTAGSERSVQLSSTRVSAAPRRAVPHNPVFDGAALSPSLVRPEPDGRRPTFVPRLDLSGLKQGPAHAPSGGGSPRRPY